MWFAGVGWESERLVTTVVDAFGSVRQARRAYGPARVDGLVRDLQHAQDRASEEAQSGLVCVIDTSTGVLERVLVEAGLDVHRVDPPRACPCGPAHGRPAGSTAVDRLVAVAREEPLALVRLTRLEGGLAGRDDEVEGAKTACGDLERHLTAQGALLVRGAPGARTVALTFDDGPHPVHTPALLDVLDRYDVRATFFCVGLQAHAHPHLVERIVTEGHTVAHHTWSHAYLPDLDGPALDHQLERTSRAIERVTGTVPSWVRPPYGGRDPRVLRHLADAGLTTVLWDVETTDWARPGARTIADDVVAGCTDGSVVLLHDGGGDRSQTVAAIPFILDRLLASGLGVAPLGELLTTGASAPAG